ncbi:MAG TPA: hypothetical protein VMA36_09830 [Candidatus Limnocylindria bacterium]|jgi:hypothetical protein|nr:hypothetical protein [Candidatus Limnocylindria bacterium]
MNPRRVAFVAAGIVSITGAYLVVAWRPRSVRATRSERMRRLAGDELISDPLASLTHAVTIERPPRAVWPWLAQMGAGRAGWYSYDAFDNGGVPSSRRILAHLTTIAVGDVFPAVPGETRGFTIMHVEPERSLVLAWRDAEGKSVVTWAFVLDEPLPAHTRLIVRARGGAGYRFFGAPTALGGVLATLVHGIMQRKQLLGIAARAEQEQDG